MKLYRAAAYFAAASGVVNALAGSPVNGWLLILLVFGFSNLLLDVADRITTRRA